jgi:DNA-binding SARP family transcriptional activator
VLSQIPFGVLIFDREGWLVGQNSASEELLGRPASQRPDQRVRCCDLLGCHRPGSALEHHCVIDLVRDARDPLPEVRIDLADDHEPGALWITVAPLHGEHVLVTLRPGQHGDRRRRTDPHWISRPHLTVVALGRTTVATAETALDGRWLQRRTGQVFKYLLVHRRRLVPVDELAETFWPAGSEHALANVRYFVHEVRGRLEPGRAKRAPSAFIVAEGGGYRLDMTRIDVDVDRFESLLMSGLAGVDRGDLRSLATVERALDLYAGDFLADEPYAEWVLGERDRLRSLAAGALRLLADIETGRDRLDVASGHLNRLAALEPFDVDVQRELLTIQIQRGRHSEAKRRYLSLRARMREHFGEDLDFTLADLAENVGHQARFLRRA